MTGGRAAHDKGNVCSVTHGRHVQLLLPQLPGLLLCHTPRPRLGEHPRVLVSFVLGELNGCESGHLGELRVRLVNPTAFALSGRSCIIN
jgi:hypothetical protein